jgi:glycosyltransferase involved in cell wall biosynthesis
MNLVLVSSDDQCGVKECTIIMRDGFEANGHRARRIGVERHSKADLNSKLREVAPDDELVIFEYEPGIFELPHLLPALARLRLLRRKRVYLSIHELEPAKLPQYHFILWRLNEPIWEHSIKEPYRWIRGIGDVVYRYATMRLQLSLLGALVNRFIVHSPRTLASAKMVTADQSKVRCVPLAVKPLDGDRDEIRRELGLPRAPFAFIVPGFLFRRKRITDAIDQLPDGTELWVVGSTSDYDPGYLEEIEAHVARTRKRDQVRIIQDYDGMERYLQAADVVVLYYREIFQSAVASLATGALKPCIFSDLPGFAEFRDAGITVRDNEQLRQAMLDIQDPQRYQMLVQGAKRLRELHSPEKTAQEYLR